MHKMAAFKCLKPETLLKKEILAQTFSCEFFQIFKNTFFTELLRVSTSILSGGRRLKQIEISIISKLHKENNNKKKMFLNFLFFTCCVHPFSFQASFFFLQRALMIHCIHYDLSYFHYVQTCWIWKTYLSTYVKN